ncbi:MAG: hypothetical protein NDI88_11105 [Lysobacter sp.]|nr:hypothetical protein [Lysobacter sp.]
MGFHAPLRITVAWALAAFLQWHSSMAAGADACKPGCGASLPAPQDAPLRIMGINYAGSSLAQVGGLREADLLGALKMSGIWVSKLPAGRFNAAAASACAWAAQRRQDFYLQLPVTYTDREIAAALAALAERKCEPRGFAIGNEVDRLVADRILPRYAVADYVADYNRIVALVKARFPAARIIALELSSFAAPRYRDDDPVTVRYKPVFDWLLPFARAKLAHRPDFVSVHFYPFTGAQKEWESLAGGSHFRRILAELEPHLAGVPPLLVGEYNATYQYEGQAAYPGSGGDSFMAALTVPDLLVSPKVAGLFHWSLVEPAGSTLGLYQGERLAPVPLFHAYGLLSGVLDHQAVAASVRRPHLEAYGYHHGGKYRVFVVNKSPFFRRAVSVSAAEGADVRFPAFCGCGNPAESLTLAPLSLTEIAGSLSDGRAATAHRRLAYADRVVRSGPLPPGEGTQPHCVPLADFAHGAFAGRHFENEEFNQNAKIGTGGTAHAISSPGGTTSLRLDERVLTVACDLPAAGRAYYQCGVKLPFVTDAMADRRAGVDWTDGADRGSLRVTVDSPAPVELEFHLEDFRPEALGYNTHRTAARVAGPATVEIPIREFRQLPGAGVARPLGEILRNVSGLRVESRQPGLRGRFTIGRLEVCDRP